MVNIYEVLETIDNAIDEVINEALEEVNVGFNRIESECVGMTECGLSLDHTKYYFDDKLVGESVDIPNSVGGYETTLLWGVGFGI